MYSIFSRIPRLLKRIAALGIALFLSFGEQAEVARAWWNNDTWISDSRELRSTNYGPEIFPFANRDFVNPPFDKERVRPHNRWHRIGFTPKIYNNLEAGLITGIAVLGIADPLWTPPGGSASFNDICAIEMRTTFGTSDGGYSYYTSDLGDFFAPVIPNEILADHNLIKFIGIETRMTAPHGIESCFATVEYLFYDYRAQIFTKAPYEDLTYVDQGCQRRTHSLFPWQFQNFPGPNPAPLQDAHNINFHLGIFLSSPRCGHNVPLVPYGRNGFTLHRVELAAAPNINIGGDLSRDMPIMEVTVVFDSGMCAPREHRQDGGNRCIPIKIGNCPTDRPGSTSQVWCKPWSTRLDLYQETILSPP